MRQSGSVCLFLAALSASGTALAQRPSAVGVCDGVSTDLRGLCHAYCEALDCDGEAPRGSATACDQLQRAWGRRSEAPPPCVPICQPEGFSLPETIDVKIAATGEIVTLDLEEYLKGVLPKEIGTSFPMAAMEAQAIASRSYAVRWILEGRGPICTTTSCQVWSPTHYVATDQAVENTRGAVGWYDGEPIWGFFFPSSGGRTSSSLEVGWYEVDYLQAVSDLENAICTDDCTAWYPVDEDPCEKNVAEGCCYGRYAHGVGLSQRGAMAMAMCGYDATEILLHYYTGISIAVPCD